MTATQTTTFTERIKGQLPARKVLVFCRAGTFPLEWPKLPDGTRLVTNHTLSPMGNKLVVTDRVEVRNIETGIGKGQSNGFMELNLDDESHPFETDREFYERIKDYLENAKDPRAVKYGVRIDEGNPFPPPFAMWDKIDAEGIGDMLARQMGDDREQNLEILRGAASHELNRKYVDGAGVEHTSRADVLHQIDMLADAAGDESDDDAPVDDSSGA